MLNIIHLEHRKDRLELLQKELAEQGIYQYKIWDGIWDRKQPCKGISKSHKQIVKFACDNKLPSIMIAEDDLKFTATGAFQYFLQNEPPDYDLYLGGIYYGNIKKDNTVDDFAGLTLYRIHQRFYNTFLSIPEETDLDRSLHLKGKFVVCDPFVVFQQNGFSDNKGAHCNYEIYLRDRKLFGCFNDSGYSIES